MTDNFQKSQCPISKLKRKSQAIFKKEKQTKINRKSLENKLKKEESITNITINKIRLFLNRTKIDDEDKVFGHYCSSELLTNLWEMSKQEIEKIEQKRQSLLSQLSNSQELTNIGSTQRQSLFLDLAVKSQDIFSEIHDKWDSQFTQIKQKPISKLRDLELCYRLRTAQDRLFEKGIVSNTIRSELIQDRVEIFYPLINEPNLTAQNLNDIIKNTIKNLSKDANNHHVHSISRFNSLQLYIEEHNLSESEMNKHFTIYDRDSNSLINNPETTQDTELIVDINLEKDYRAHSKNFYGCPALYTRTPNSKNSIFKEIIEYKLNFFKDVYLALESNKSDSYTNQEE
jgi:hypothetical protein